MKLHFFQLCAMVLAPLVFPFHAQGQGKGGGHGKGRGGMPDEMREVIHELFDGHEKIQRNVEVTATGYRSTTVTEDQDVAQFLQTHVRQMEKRLKSGLRVRRWDPAYEEFVKHYEDIDIEITNIEGGVSIVATGKTEDARKVARNHAGIIGKFVAHGWSEHDKTHPAVLSGNKVVEPVTDAALGDTKLIHRVGDVFLASQPAEGDLLLAKERGFKTVLNTRHSDEFDFDEGSVVKELGMQFVSIPWNGEEELTDRVFDEVRATLKTAEKPILFHCSSANRAAGVWLARRVLDEGVEWETALKEAEVAGLKSEAYEARARDYVERRHKVSQLTEAQRQACLEIGEKASSSLMKNLGTQLKGALAGGDVRAAITVCETAAQPITEATSDDVPGVTVGRTSLKVRNAGSNSPDASDLEILNQWQEMGKQSDAIEPAVIQVHENAVRYYRPIFTQEVCLKCHGPADGLDKEVRERLTELYPDDRATGYAEGDLRGVFRVEIDLEKALE